MAGITSDLAQKIRRPPAEGLRGGLRTISAGTTLLGHTVVHLENVKKKSSVVMKKFGRHVFFSPRLSVKKYSKYLSYCIRTSFV